MYPRQTEKESVSVIENRNIRRGKVILRYNFTVMRTLLQTFSRNSRSIADREKRADCESHLHAWPNDGIIDLSYSHRKEHKIAIATVKMMSQDLFSPTDISLSFVFICSPVHIWFKLKG